MKDVNETGTYKKRNKFWYYNQFPLLPILSIREADEYNTKAISFKWLFFTFWTLDSFSFDLSLAFSAHWGVGVIGILPYLRWAITIPLPWGYKVESKLTELLDRKVKRAIHEN